MVSTLHVMKVPLQYHLVMAIRLEKKSLILLYTRRNPDKYDTLPKVDSMTLLHAGIHLQQALNVLGTIPSNADRLMGSNPNQQ